MNRPIKSSHQNSRYTSVKVGITLGKINLNSSMFGRNCLLFCLLVFITEGDATNFKELEKVIKQYLKCKNSPGLALSVVKNGHIVMSNGFGVKRFYSSEAVTNKTLFGISSVTKGFTSILIV